MNRFQVLVTVSLLLAIAPTQADTSTRSVQTEVILSATPEQVRDAFLGGEDLKAWWKVSRSLVEAKTGGIWSIAWDDWGDEKTQHAWSGVVEELTPSRIVIGRMVMNEPGMPLMGPMRIEIDIAAADSGTRLHLTHHGYGYGEHWDKMYDLVVQGWDHVLGDLEDWFVEQY